MRTHMRAGPGPRPLVARFIAAAAEVGGLAQTTHMSPYTPYASVHVQSGRSGVMCARDAVRVRFELHCMVDFPGFIDKQCRVTGLMAGSSRTSFTSLHDVLLHPYGSLIASRKPASAVATLGGCVRSQVDDQVIMSQFFEEDRVGRARYPPATENSVSEEGSNRWEVQRRRSVRIVLSRTSLLEALLGVATHLVPIADVVNPSMVNIKIEFLTPPIPRAGTTEIRFGLALHSSKNRRAHAKTSCPHPGNRIGVEATQEGFGTQGTREEAAKGGETEAVQALLGCLAPSTDARPAPAVLLEVPGPVR
ncbi:hypothetical protein EDB89DRAFT_1908275 [Lactarius sanguifluus]|nr:hypothetical protein EDB89DRAFT_1908275 [Lactarius sanguifluus]